MHNSRVDPLSSSKPGSCEECEANSFRWRTERLSVIPTDECAQKTMNTEKGCTNAKKIGQKGKNSDRKAGMRRDW